MISALTTLYRAAAAEHPHLGQGSYWTTSSDFAQRFAIWLDGRAAGQHVVYEADVALGDVLDVPFGVFLSSPDVSRRVGELAAQYRWVAFYERGAFEGKLIKQYVYLGQQVIIAERWQAERDPATRA